MTLWILIHHHRHGVDVLPIEAENEAALPDPEATIAAAGSELDTDPEGDEWTEWAGPWHDWPKSAGTHSPEYLLGQRAP